MKIQRTPKTLRDEAAPQEEHLHPERVLGGLLVEELKERVLDERLKDGIVGIWYFENKRKDGG